MSTDFDRERDRIEQAIALATVERPAYAHLYPFLEALFIARAGARQSIRLVVPEISADLAESRWNQGSPLLRRWDFPVDVHAAERVLAEIGKAISRDNSELADAHQALTAALAARPAEKEAFWGSFLHHELEPWAEWIDTDAVDQASVLFLARSALRPSLESTAETLLAKTPIPATWLKGHCPVCGSLPSLLYLESEGERKAFCSWCATRWDIHRLQCPYCDNRFHESLGYISIETESWNRVSYCNLCKYYFKQIDTRALAYSPYLPLEEWLTLHLDILAHKNGYNQPPSLAPAVYGEEDRQ